MGKNVKNIKKAAAAKGAKAKPMPKKTSNPPAKSGKSKVKVPAVSKKAATKPKASPSKEVAKKKNVLPPSKAEGSKSKAAAPVRKSTKIPVAEKVSSKKVTPPTAAVKEDKPKKGLAEKSSKESSALGGSNKKSKKTKPDSSLDEELLSPVDDDMGGEDLPDLSEFEEDIVEEIEETVIIEEELVTKKEEAPSEEVILTDAEGRRYCKVKDCDQIAVVDGYCRFHYLFLWKKIQVRRKILIDGKLQRYVEELTARYPDKFLEIIRKDLRTEKDFLAAIAELEIDESAVDSEYEDDSQVLDEVRGFGGGEGSLSDDDEF